MASEKPGKLKFNAAMFNPAAFKPGAKNAKLEELKKKRANAPTEPLKTTDDQFSRPSIPLRRARSKAKLNLDNDQKDQDQIYNQSFINNDPIFEEETKTDNNDTDIKENDSKENDITSKLDTALKQRKPHPPPKIAPAIQDAARKLEHQKKTDNINKKLEARSDIDEMLDNRIIQGDPRKVHGSLHETQATLTESLNDRASKEFLQRTNILKYDNLDASLQPTADDLEQKLNERSPNTPDKVAPSLAATSKKLDKQIRSDKVNQSNKNRTSFAALQQQGIIPSDNVAPSLAGTAKQLDKQIKTDKLSQSLTDENRKTKDELKESGVIKYGNLSSNLIQNANKLESQVKGDKLNANLRNRPDVEELVDRNILNTSVDASLQQTQNQLKMQQQKDKLSQNLRNREDVDTLAERNILNTSVDASLQQTQNALKMQQQKDKLSKGLRNRQDIDTLHDQNIINKNVSPQYAATQKELEAQKKKDIINQKLTHEDRPTQDELEQQDILYSKQMAPAIQSNAKELEQQIREIQNKSEDNGSNKSIDQSPTQTDIDLEEEQKDAFKPLNGDISSMKRMSNEALQKRADKKMEKRMSKPIGLDNTEITTERKRISKSLESRLSIRKTPQDLENYGIVPPDYFDDPQGAYEMRLIQRKLAEEDLKRNLKTKPTPEDIVQKGLAHDEFWEKNVDETHENRRNIMEEKKRKLEQAHRRRPSLQDLVAQQIMPEDSEVIAELKNIAKSHKRMESAVKDLSQRLPFEDDTNKSVAETMMKHINDTEDDIDLLWTTSEEDEDDNGYKARESEEESQHSSIDYDASSDIEMKEEDKPTFDLGAVQKRNHKRRLSQDLENFYANRRTIEELEDENILKQTNIANSLRGSAVALEAAMNNQPKRTDLIQRNIIKRPSISRSLQPNADALENELIRNLNKMKSEEDMEFKQVDQQHHPLFKRETNDLSKERRAGGHQRKKSSGFGTKKGQNPEYYKHDIAPKLQDTANRLHKRKISQQIEHSLNARPTKQELIDSRILYKEHMANQLQGNALQLEEQLKQRVPEEYLQRIGVLLHDADKVAPAIQGPSYELEYALRRRPSLFDGTSNSDMMKILGIPDNTDNPHEYYTNEMSRERRGKEKDNNYNDNRPLQISAFEEMYPDDNDKTNYRLRRARNSDKLEKRMSRRMSQTDLEKVGIIPTNYWDDPHGAIEMQQIHRKLAAEDLKRGLRNRSSRQELVDRGLTRAEYFDMDMDKAKKAIVNYSQNTKKQVENQLNSIFNPQLIELEKRGIVESGYFLTRAKQIEDGHRRLVSVTSELQQKLLSNPSYNEELAKTLVQDLQSDSEEEEDEDGDGDGYDDDSDEEDSDDSDSDGSEGSTDSDEEFMDSDDEEQARRLQELEYKIGHRPSTDELIEKRILYKKVSDMAPAIQGNAQQLQKVIGKRPSLADINEKGILQSTNQDMIDKRDHLLGTKNKKHKHKHKNKKNKDGKKHKNKKINNKDIKKHAHLNKKLGRRRPTMIDLEKRGIVPSGYFDDVEQAMREEKIRKENIIHDLTFRLQSRPEFSEKLARGLMSKAMDSIHKRDDIIASGKGDEQKQAIQQILTAKLADRVGVQDLKDKNILSGTYNVNMSHKLNAQAESLKRQQLKSSLQNKLNAQPTEEQMYDDGYLKYKRHGNHSLSHELHGTAVELEELIQQRPNEEYLKDKGIINPHHKKLNDAIQSRPSIGHLEQSGLVPHGVFDDLNAAKKAKHDRVQSIHDELNAFFEYDRPTQRELIEKGIFNMPQNNMPQKKRLSVEIREEEEDSDEEEEISIISDHSDHSDEDEDESIYNSPDIPPVPDRNSSLFQQNTYTEIVMNSITFHNKKAVEPSYSIDLLVAEPDLTDDIIQTSTLSFLNVLDNLQGIINDKIEYAQINYINKMKIQSKDLQSLKNLLRNLQDYGLSIINEEFDGIEFFESCGDIEKDINNVWKEIMRRQEELYKLDNEYIIYHVEIKKLQNIKNELNEYCDKYKIQLSQLKRVKQRIETYIEENKMTKDSSNEAMKATDSNQAWMISKITNKIVKLQSKIDSLTPNSEEYVTCNNFLNGLREFSKGLKKLRKGSNDKIQHLQNIIEKLKEQETDIIHNIKEIRSNAIQKLNTIRQQYININDEINGDDNKYDDSDSDDDDDDNISSDDEEIINNFNNNNNNTAAPLSMLELMHKREKYMTKVYKKIHDLESRAMTTSSTDYLRGLTEIRELQIILNNPLLKYFYNHFVSICNEIFNDCCLANQAILENTAEINTPLITSLKGIKLLNNVLEKNKRKLLNNDENVMQYLENIVIFIQSLPDREVVIMQIARHLSLSLPFRSFISGKDDIIKEREKRKRLQSSQQQELKDDDDDDEEDEHHLIKIDKFIQTKIREWIGSILNIYGNNAFASVKVALENDVVAQVRPSYAARLIVNCVYGLDVSL